MSRSASERFAIAAAALLLNACTTELLREPANSAYLDARTPVALPVRSLQTRKFLTVRRQQLDFSCGSAALASLLTWHYDDPQDEQTVFLGMWRDGDQAQIRRLGFSLLDMKRYLAARGIASDGYQVTIDQIRQAATPGIALIDIEGYKHFVVVKDVDDRGVLLGDPALGVRRMTRGEFTRSWNGVLFVAMPPTTVKARFGAARDRTLAPAAPLGELPTLPLTLEALALTRPLPGDF